MSGSAWLRCRRSPGVSPSPPSALPCTPCHRLLSPTIFEDCYSEDIEKKILSMYAKGMTTSDIEGHIRDIYGVDVSDTTVSRITDKILPTAKE